MIRIRNSVFVLVAAAFCAASIFTNCELGAAKAGENEDSVSKAKADMVLAKEDRIQAQRDSVADYKKFKTESEARVIKNGQIIADFNVRIMIGRVSMKGRYQKRLDELERKNNNMKTRLELYSETGTDKWEIFKREWDRDMGMIVKSLNEITKDNKQ